MDGAGFLILGYPLEAVTAVVTAGAALVNALAASVAAGAIVYFGIGMRRDNKDRKEAADLSAQALRQQGEALTLAMNAVAEALTDLRDLRQGGALAE